MVGTIFNIGCGKIELSELENVLKYPSSNFKITLAPSCGLHKRDIVYPPDAFLEETIWNKNLVTKLAAEDLSLIGNISPETKWVV